MRALVLHNAYRYPGGEEEVLAQECALLESAGHEIRTMIVSSATLRGPLQTIRAGINLPYSSAARNQLTDCLAATKPDVVHLHNYFPLLTPSVLDACADARIPVVHTLHNYRIVCANGLLFRDGAPCQLCLRGSPLNAVRFRCYGRSRAASLAVARMIVRHRRLQTWQSKVDRFIAPSAFCKELLASAGLPRDRIAVKPHFTLPLRTTSLREPRGYALFVGRLSAEKGIKTLLRAWQQVPHQLHIVGDGPLREEVQSAAAECDKISYRGAMSRTDVEGELQDAAYLVFPSLLPETFGLTIIEAFAHGIPVIASRLGSQADLVEDESTGLLFEAGNAFDLAAKAMQISTNHAERDEMAARARIRYRRSYTAAQNLPLLLGIYDDARTAAMDRYGSLGTPG